MKFVGSSVEESAGVVVEEKVETGVEINAIFEDADVGEQEKRREKRRKLTVQSSEDGLP